MIRSNDRAALGAQAGRTIHAKIGAVLLALALCLSLAPRTAFAENSASGDAQAAPMASSEQTAGTATLTIVYGLGFDGSPNVVVNTKYRFSEGATVEGLFAAAKAAGEIKDYVFVDEGYGSYIRSVTLKTGAVVENAPDGSLYWGSYKNGAYAVDAEAQGTEALADGASYQFAWSSYPTAAAPSDWTPIVGAADASTQIAGGDAKKGVATLSVVAGLDLSGKPIIAVNKQYPFAEDATVEDLFAAAKAAGDIQDYSFKDMSYGPYLFSVTPNKGATLANAAGSPLSWSTYKNKQYASGTEGQSGDALVDGVTYQFAWSSFPTAQAPADWTALVASATDGSEVAVPPIKPPTTDETYDPVALDSEAYAQLFSSIASSFAATAEPWEALDLAAIGQSSAVDKDALVDSARESIGVANPTALQKNILALTAIGVDADGIANQDGTSLIDSLGSTAMATNGINGRAFALLAYKSGPYVVPAGASSEQQLIDDVLASQLPDGGFALDGTSAADPDVTAMVIAALAPYRSDARVEAALQDALSALKSLQLADGGFPSLGNGGLATQSNVNSTAVAVIALAAVGIDPATSWAVESGETPLSALLSFANESRTGFVFGASENEMATEQGFRAMVAYQGFKNTGAAYNVYLQAADGVAGLPGAAEAPAANDDRLAKTGDATPVAGAAGIALCALVGLAAAVRRRGVCSQRASMR